MTDTATHMRKLGLARDRSREVLEALAIEPPPFVVDALCAQVDHDIFFPERGGSTRPAKRVCAACPVRSACLTYALEHSELYGIWGGLSERERRGLTRGVA